MGHETCRARGRQYRREGCKRRREGHNDASWRSSRGKRPILTNMRLLSWSERWRSRAGAFGINERPAVVRYEYPLRFRRDAVLWERHSNRSADSRHYRLYSGATREINVAERNCSQLIDRKFQTYS